MLYQTCLSFRDLGDEVRKSERANGLVNLLLAAGQAFRPDTRRFIELGLPLGPNRAWCSHLNAEVLRTQSPLIELEDSLTAFVKRTLELDAGGRTIRTVKDQLTRLSAADFRLRTVLGERSAVTLKRVRQVRFRAERRSPAGVGPERFAPTHRLIQNSVPRCDRFRTADNPMNVKDRRSD